MRLLHVTDTHLGVDRWFRGAPRGWRRGDDHLAAFRAALAPAFRGEVDGVVHTGDLFDRSRPPARAVAEAIALLAEVARQVPVALMPGNHDRQGLRAHLAGGGLPGVAIVDRAARVRIAGAWLALVPYLPDPAAWGAAASDVCGEGVDLLLAHQAFDGARVPGFAFRVGSPADTIGEAHLPPGVRHILCGHIHTRQALALGAAVVVHPGSTERTAFLERAETKGSAVWELGAEPTWRFVDGPARPMHVVEHPDALALVSAEELVTLKGAARHVEVEQAALARGAWVAPLPAPTPQMTLFAPRR
ncbi:MAG: metallophosphoesterase [Pseudomonadota bacterium]|nr:metallophosphoesterase [Pseudomonadota bacterium]